MILYYFIVEGGINIRNLKLLLCVSEKKSTIFCKIMLFLNLFQNETSGDYNKALCALIGEA
jgi:hypothetical protein